MAAAPPSRGAALRSATAAAVLALALGVGVPAVAHAALPAPKLPPIDKANKTRCVVSSSAMGQANAARDSLLDLRECPLSAADLSGFDISGAILTGADLSGANLSGTQMSKSYVYKANLSGANLTSAILDRVTFDGSDLTGALLVNAVLSDSTFVGANLKDTDWTDVYMGEFATRAACSNKTLAGTNPVTGEDSRASLGCR
ncbi:hypothetical protein MMPV_007682 [Pyropia vietnamensis]